MYILFWRPSVFNLRKSVVRDSVTLLGCILAIRCNFVSLLEPILVGILYDVYTGVYDILWCPYFRGGSA